MAADRDGKSFGIPVNRRLSWDLLFFNHSIPQCAHDRVCDLSSLAEARDLAGVRISWPALFLKAFGLVAAEVPQLRQTWYRWPWATLYQHPHSVGIVTVHREFQGEPWLFWGRIPQPERKSLVDIQSLLDTYRTGPVEDVFDRELQLAHLPTVIRRLLWGWNIHVARRKRMKRLGTFFLSTLAGRGVTIQVPPSVQTACLTYGPLDPEGRCQVTLAYDHRVLDGVLISECLNRLERVLLETVRCEVLQLKNQATKMFPAA